MFATKNIIISNFLLTLTSFAVLWITVCHLQGSATCFPYMANIMGKHSYSIAEFVWKYLSIHSEIILNLFYEQTILLFCLEVAASIHNFKTCKLGILQKHSLDRAIIICIPKDASRQLFCVLENFYVSGTQDAGVTKSWLQLQRELSFFV